MFEQSGSSNELPNARLVREIIFGLLFAVTGGLLGGMGGNGVAALVGTLIGAVLGTVAGWSVDVGAVQKARHEASLDRTIGTEGGSVGVTGLERPPLVVGALSRGASGITGSVEDTEAAGPITRPPD